MLPFGPGGPGGPSSPCTTTYKQARLASEDMSPVDRIELSVGLYVDYRHLISSHLIWIELNWTQSTVQFSTVEMR